MFWLHNVNFTRIIAHEIKEVFVFNLYDTQLIFPYYKLQSLIPSLHNA